VKSMVRDDKGLTLIEVLAAIVILSVVILAFVNISGYTAQSSSKSDKKAGALRLAELTMNTLRNTVDSSSSIMNVFTLPTPTPPPPNANGYSIAMSETLLTATPSYSVAEFANKVSLQDIFILHDPVSNTDVNHLITITVSWAG